MTSRSLWMEIDVAPDAKPLAATNAAMWSWSVLASPGSPRPMNWRNANSRSSSSTAGRICSGMTARTTAHLAPLCDDLMSEMTKLRGQDLAKGFYQSQAAAITHIEQIQMEEDDRLRFSKARRLPVPGPQTAR